MHSYIVYTAEVRDSMEPFITVDSEGREWHGRTEKESINLAISNGVSLSARGPRITVSGMNFGHSSDE